jgi:hypothetical protein
MMMMMMVVVVTVMMGFCGTGVLVLVWLQSD